MRHFPTLLVLGLFLSACAADRTPFVPVEVPPSSGVGGGGAGQVAPFPPSSGGGGSGGGGAPDLVFDDSAIDLGRAGAFPSDLAADSRGRLYTVDDALVPCNLLGFDRNHDAALSVAIGAGDLIDMNGTSPARSVTAFRRQVDFSEDERRLRRCLWYS